MLMLSLENVNVKFRECEDGFEKCAKANEKNCNTLKITLATSLYLFLHNTDPAGASRETQYCLN